MKWHREWFIRVPWGKLAMVSRGHPDGEPVFLVHGRQDSLSIFEPLIELMSEQYYYVALDMPGNGLSDAFPHVTNEPLPKTELNYAVVFNESPKAGRPFIEFNKYTQRLIYIKKTDQGPKLQRFHFLYAMELALLHLGWDKFIFMGHSMGCEQGLFYNVIYPGQITKMILLDAGPTLMRMQIEDNAEYEKLFYDSYYENYHSDNFKRKIHTRLSATQSLQRVRELSEAQCEHLLARNFHEFGLWFPMEVWHPKDVRVIARKTFLITFDVDDENDESVSEQGARIMLLWNMKEVDLFPLNEQMKLVQSPYEPRSIYACGEKDAVKIYLTKYGQVEAIEDCTLNIINEEIESFERPVEEDSSHDNFPSCVPKNLGPAEMMFYLRTTAKKVNMADEARSSGGGMSNEGESSDGGNKAQCRSGITNKALSSCKKTQTTHTNCWFKFKEQTSAQGRSNETQIANKGSLNKDPNTNKKRSYYYCDFCVITSTIMAQIDVIEIHRQAMERGLPYDLEVHFEDDIDEITVRLSKILNDENSSDVTKTLCSCSHYDCPIPEDLIDDKAESDETDYSAPGTSTMKMATLRNRNTTRSPPPKLRRNTDRRKFAPGTSKPGFVTLGSLKMPKPNAAQFQNRASNLKDSTDLVIQYIQEENSLNGSPNLSLVNNAMSVAGNSGRPSNDTEAGTSNQANLNQRPNRSLNEAQNSPRTPNFFGNRRQKKDEPTDTDDEFTDTDEELTDNDEQNAFCNANRSQKANRRLKRSKRGGGKSSFIQRMRKSDKEGYLSWDNRLKHLAPQNYGNDYYFELFKTIPPTLLIAASDGAKNVPPIPKWHQGAKELLDKMSTLDNYHRVDVEGSHDVHYTHPERVVPFINAFLKDNKVCSKL